jgi:V8-like Glu-specific endopeptidase
MPAEAIAMNLDALVAQIVGQQQEASGDLAPSSAQLPTPGHFYTIKPGDTLLGLAGQAYELSPGAARLAAARLINDAFYNRRFRDASLTDNGLFPEGRISFNPRFTCDVSHQSQVAGAMSKGRCFARIWLPELYPTVFTGPADAPAAPRTIGHRVLDQLQEPYENCDPAPGPIVGDDDRRPVNDTLRAPFRWICRLVSTFRPIGTSAFSGAGTGFIVDPETIVTAAHVLDDPDYGIPDQIVVLPGLNKASASSPFSAQTAPFGAFLIERRARSSNFFVPPEWRASRSTQHDYGLIRFRKDQQLLSGKPIEDGWNTVSKSLADVGVANIERQKNGRADSREVARLLRIHSGRIAVAGYNADRPCRQLEAHGGHARRLLFPDAADHNVMESFLDATAGASGGPYWIVRPLESGRRQHILIGLHTGRALFRDRIIQAALMVVITPEIWHRLQSPSLLASL